MIARMAFPPTAAPAATVRTLLQLGTLTSASSVVLGSRAIASAGKTGAYRGDRSDFDLVVFRMKHLSRA